MGGQSKEFSFFPVLPLVEARKRTESEMFCVAVLHWFYVGAWWFWWVICLLCSSYKAQVQVLCLSKVGVCPSRGSCPLSGTSVHFLKLVMEPSMKSVLLDRWHVDSRVWEVLMSVLCSEYLQNCSSPWLRRMSSQLSSCIFYLFQLENFLPDFFPSAFVGTLLCSLL